MPTQVQIRGATQATQEARTLAARELDINTTDARLCAHDGSTAGGMKHVNARDAQNQEFTYAAASGTDTITATYAFTPSSYANGQKFGFKAANNNTGAATFNANSVGAVTIKKVSGGALADLDADDIVQDAYYEVEYNGTYFVIVGGVGGGAGTRPKTTGSLSGAGLALTDIFEPGNNYRIVVSNISHAVGGSGLRDFLVHLSDDSASTWETSGYLMKGHSSDGTTLRVATSTGDIAGITASLTNESMSFLVIDLLDPAASGKTFIRVSGHIFSGGSVHGVSGAMDLSLSGYLNIASSVDSIRFQTVATSGMTGNVAVYETPTS